MDTTATLSSLTYLFLFPSKFFGNTAYLALLMLIQFAGGVECGVLGCLIDSWYG